MEFGMREVYSTQLAIIVGFLIVSVTAIFALMQSPETLSVPERTFIYMPHPVEGHEQCDICHGLKGTVPYPVRHLGWSNKSCAKCHLSGPAATAASSVDNSRKKGEKAPLTPHHGEGWEDCVACHAVDSKVRPAPSDHKGRTNNGCSNCHFRKQSH